VALKIIPDSDPILHTQCEVFNPRSTDFPLKETIAEMFTLMRENNGIGLAAPQVGINKRFFIMEINGVKSVCINPKILSKNNVSVSDAEGCLSYPGTRVEVARPTEIRVKYMTPTGMSKTKTLRHLNARCFQHELDHLDGVVITDLGEPVSVSIQHNGPAVE